MIGDSKFEDPDLATLRLLCLELHQHHKERLTGKETKGAKDIIARISINQKEEKAINNKKPNQVEAYVLENFYSKGQQEEIV